jgi:hypothetical protein
VTAVVRGCSLDWVLATPGESQAAQGAFEAWWGSFELPAETEAES